MVNYSRSREDAEATVDAIRSRGGTAIAIAADISEQADANALMAAAEREFGRIDFLINNAGWSQRVPHHQMDDLTDEIWDRVVRDQSARRLLLRARRGAVSEEAARRGGGEHRVRGRADGTRQFHGLRGFQRRYGHPD